jgi:hypothetical protein
MLCSFRTDIIVIKVQSNKRLYEPEVSDKMKRKMIEILLGSVVEHWQDDLLLVSQFYCYRVEVW